MNPHLTAAGLLATALVLGTALAARAADVSGDQSGTWTLAQSPYVAGGTTVPAGQTLTIEPGVVVRFHPGAYLSVRGTLNAVGTASAPITFTSNGNLAAGTWNSVCFEEGSAGTLSNCKVWYAGNWDGAGILVRGTAVPTITNCQIAHIGGNGLVTSDTAHPSLTGNTISDVADWPVRLNTWSALPTFEANTFDTARKGVRFDNATVPEGQQVIWPDPGYPYSVGCVPIERSARLTLPAGLVLKFDDGGWMDVREGATLVARGTASQPITFTSVRDDDSGGDTNGDGTATQPARAVWNCLVFSSSTGVVENCRVRYAGNWDGAGILVRGTATPTISACQIAHIGGDGLKVYDTATPAFAANNVFEDLSGFGARNHGTGTVNARSNWWGDASGPLHATLNPAGRGFEVSDRVDF
ncbi:MAG: right-handed parallel beta-helix repeat-containing protein [Candidatus Latescibacterota bacterium]